MARYSGTLTERLMTPRNSGRLEYPDLTGYAGTPGRGAFLVETKTARRIGLRRTVCDPGAKRYHELTWCTSPTQHARTDQRFIAAIEANAVRTI
jgi:hypothetical protein